jgi:hypothetical protein
MATAAEIVSILNPIMDLGSSKGHAARYFLQSPSPRHPSKLDACCYRKEVGRRHCTRHLEGMLAATNGLSTNRGAIRGRRLRLTG